LYRTEIIAQVQFAGGPNTADYRFAHACKGKTEMISPAI